MFDWIKKRILAQTRTVSTAGGWEDIRPSRTDTGIPINGVSIYTYPPYYYAVSRIAGHIGAMSIHLKRRNEDGSSDTIKAKESPLVNLVGLTPNPYMSAMDWKETAQGHVITWGNGRTAIIRDPNQVPIELWPLQPERVRTEQVFTDDGTIIKQHWYTTLDGRHILIPDRDMIHVKNLGHEGIEGWSMIRLAAESIAGGLAGDKMVNAGYANQSLPSYVLEAPDGILNDGDIAKDFKENYNLNFAGMENAGKVPLLRFGISARPLTISGRDAQIVENRKHSREDAALWTAIEQMLGIEGQSAYNSVEQRNAAYRTNCLAKFLAKWEQELTLKLLSKRQRDLGYYFKFDERSLLKGSTKERYDNYALAKQIGLLTVDEMREEEGLPKLPESERPQPVVPPPVVPDDQEEVEEGDEEDQVQNLIRAQVDRLLTWESDALIRLSQNPDRFVKRVETWYRRATPKYVDLVDSLDCDQSIVADWINGSQERILVALDGVTKGQLPGRIEDLVSDWMAERISDLTDSIMEARRLWTSGSTTKLDRSTTGARSRQDRLPR